MSERELRKVVKAAIDLIAGESVGLEWKSGCADFLKQARAALSQPAPQCAESILADVIRNDALAISCQTLGQYRTMLLKHLAQPPQASEPAQKGILDGLSQEAIDGGWTYRGMNAYTVRLETSIRKMMARLAELLDEDQFSELERLASPVTPKASEPAEHPGCSYCNHPLFAAMRCECGKVFSTDDGEPAEPPPVDNALGQGSAARGASPAPEGSTT